MSIYETNQKIDISKKLNNKKLTTLLKSMKGGPKKASKEVLYDIDDNIIGVLLQNNTPYFFNDKEYKEFIALYNQEK